MNDDPRAAALAAFSSVLEQTAFMFAEPAEPDALADTPDRVLAARMSFSGPFSGSMGLYVPEEMCPLLAENMLGIEPDDGRVMEKARDALKEILNMTCGSTLTSLAGEEPVFDLTVPTVQDLDQQQWDAVFTDEQTVVCSVDDYPALLQIIIEG